MNREFIIPELTPAIARKIKRLLDATDAYIDPEILKVADQDKIVDNTLSQNQLDCLQYIHDFEHRCVIPFNGMINGESVRKAIVRSLPDDAKILIHGEPMQWSSLFPRKIRPYKEGSDYPYQFTSDIFNYKDTREHIVLTGLFDNYALTSWIGKYYPKIICYGKYEHQNSFCYSRVQNMLINTAIALYPMAEEDAPRLHLKKNYIMAGIYTGFMKFNNEKIPASIVKRKNETM